MSSLNYRQLAERERQIAEHLHLPQLRKLHLNSAARWDMLAAEAELSEPGKKPPGAAEQTIFY